MPEKDTNSTQLGAFRAPNLEEERAKLVEPIKDFRKQIDALIARVSTANGYEKGDLLPNDYRVREVARQVELKLIEAKMWAGKMLEGLGTHSLQNLQTRRTYNNYYRPQLSVTMQIREAGGLMSPPNVGIAALHPALLRLRHALARHLH